MRGQAWSGERVDLLKKLWREGLTAAVIGERLGGLSRAAVLGKVFRLRLHSETAGCESPTPQKLAAPDRVEGAPVRRRRRQPRRQQSPATPAAVSQHKTLFELTNRTCRWPHGQPGTGKFFFCGALDADLEQGIPYCAQHMRRAYRPCVRVEKAAPIAVKLRGAGGV